jgi:resuscitation-promoting factor RpfB
MLKNYKHLFLLITLVLGSCAGPKIQQADIDITIIVDGKSELISLSAGSSVKKALEAASLSLNPLDRVVPPLYTVLSNGSSIRVIRVTEEFSQKIENIPFEHQELRSESLAFGESRLIQAGQNGAKELTIRRVIEDGIEVNSSVVKEVIVQAAKPEIVMIGVQASFIPIQIEGKIAYMAAGNAWIMETSTSIRRPIITSGDLDGRIFSLSPDGDWLLFTRKSGKPLDQEINTLWVVSTVTPNAVPIFVKGTNIIHFADFVPGKENNVAYSTVEPRAIAPGWQANNDLYTVTFNPGGGSTTPKRILETNSGGLYGWWGTNYAFSPDGKHLAYSRPDGIGFVDLAGGTLTSAYTISPYNTHSDWAWIPGLAWGADNNTLFIVTHALSQGLINNDDSPFFDLAGISISNHSNVLMVSQVGMFSSPSSSPLFRKGIDDSYNLAFLEAIYPAQSDTSRYRLVIMDRDGSNRRVVFPDDQLPGLEAQRPIWAPIISGASGGLVAIVYEGNLWLIDVSTGQAQQVTGDGLINNIDWH